MTEYCWSRDRGDLHGPFETVALAIEDAMEVGEPTDTISVAETAPVVPEDWADVLDVEGMMERMDEYLGGECMFDDPVFEVPDARVPAAQDALAGYLRAWAREYVEVNGQFMSGTVVRVATIAELRGGVQP